MTKNLEWTPVPFQYVLTGHLFTGGIIGIGTLIISDILAYFLVEEPPYALTFMAVGLSVVLKESAAAALSYRRSLKFENPAPGGLVVPFANVAFAVVSYGLVCGLILGFSAMFAIIVSSALLLEIGTAVASRSWDPGMTREEVRTAWEETKKMTTELAQED